MAPPIYYSDLKKSTITIKSQFHKFDETLKQDKKLKFHRYDDVDDILNKKDVRQVLSINIFENLNKITVLYQPKEKFKRISEENNVKEGPDFIYK